MTSDVPIKKKSVIFRISPSTFPASTRWLSVYPRGPGVTEQALRGVVAGRGGIEIDVVCVATKSELLQAADTPFISRPHLVEAAGQGLLGGKHLDARHHLLDRTPPFLQEKRASKREMWRGRFGR